MSEKIYACLLRLYPARFRRAYGEEALRLFGDRLRDETGFLPRLRLWLDILVDLALSLPGQYAGAEPAWAVQASAHTAGTPCFFVLEEESVRPGALFSGCVLTLAALSLATALLNQAVTVRSLPSGSTQSRFSASNSRLAPNDANSPHTAAQPKRASASSEYRFVPSEEFFPPPIDYLKLTNVRRNPIVQQIFVFATPGNSAAPKPLPLPTVSTVADPSPACVGGSALDPGRQRVFDAVITNLKQHYFDPAVARQMADALVARQLCGDDAFPADDESFAALLTAQIRDVSHDMHLEVVYSPPRPSQATKDELALTFAAFQEDNCSFHRVKLLPHNIGYLRLDAFLEPSRCGSIAVAAMASLNNADALIFDLRNNRGGTAEMVSLISSYLFDHPVYMFNPRRTPTPQSWTSSPVPSSKLVNKPVFILTSPATISAAEQFTYNLKMLKRATIVGETTAGAAHAGVWHRIDDHFGMAIPEIRAVNPYSQFDWEGTGIQPDVKVPASAALRAALTQARSQLHKK